MKKTKKALFLLVLTGVMILGFGMTSYADGTNPDFGAYFQSKGNIEYVQDANTVSFYRSDLDKLQRELVDLANELPDTEKNEWFTLTGSPSTY